MSETSRTVAGGTTGSLPDYAVAVDNAGSKDFQRIKLTDATTDSTSSIGIDANPLKVKNRRFGTSDYDSGVVAIPGTAPASVTTATIYPEQGFISNPTAAAIDVTLQNTAGTSFAVLTVAPKSVVPFPLSGALVGLKAGASSAGCYLSVVGGQ